MIKWGMFSTFSDKSENWSENSRVSNDTVSLIIFLI